MLPNFFVSCLQIKTKIKQYICIDSFPWQVLFKLGLDNLRTLTVSIYLWNQLKAVPTYNVRPYQRHCS